MSHYARTIAQELGCAEDEAARIEVVIRWEHVTLNSLSKARLKREMKIAQQVLAELRAEAADSVEARAMLAQVEMEAEAGG